MSSKKVLILHNSNGERVRVIFDNNKLIGGLLNAIDNDNLQREDLAYVIAQMLRSLSSSSKKVEFRNEKLEERTPLPQNVVSYPSNLEERLNKVYNEESLNYPEHLNPFTPAMSKIRLNKFENAKLDRFLNAVTRANNANELNEVVNTALEKLDRINVRNRGDWSFANFVLFKMSLNKFSEEEQRNIMHKLIVKGATFDDDLFDDKRIEKIHNELEKELQPRLHNQLTELRKAAENASISGTVQNVEFDNRTFFMEFSKDSVVDVAKITSGTRKLGFNRGNLNLGGDIVKIGNNEVELKVEKDGKMNYLGVSDNGSIKLTFRMGSRALNIHLYHSSQDYNKVQVRVDNEQLWEEFKNEAVVKNCLLGDIPLEKVVERGNFTRCGRLGSQEVKEKAKEICKGLFDNSEKSKTPWVDKLLHEKKTICEIV